MRKKVKVTLFAFALAGSLSCKQEQEVQSSPGGYGREEIGKSQSTQAPNNAQQKVVFRGSCLMRETEVRGCTEVYAPANDLLSYFESSCVPTGGQWTTSTCPTANIIAGCKRGRQGNLPGGSVSYTYRLQNETPMATEEVRNQIKRACPAPAVFILTYDSNMGENFK